MLLTINADQQGGAVALDADNNRKSGGRSLAERE
jgi:hypothetical protein